MKTPVRYSGPYLYKSGKNAGRKFMVVYYSDGSRGTTLYSRYLYEHQRGRKLDKMIHIDHIDEDKTNDNADNLQEISKEENARKHNRLTPRKTITFVCPICEKPSTKYLNNVKHCRKQGKAGPFCGRKCARQYQLRCARGETGSTQRS